MSDPVRDRWVASQQQASQRMAAQRPANPTQYGQWNPAMQLSLEAAMQASRNGADGANLFPGAPQGYGNWSPQQQYADAQRRLAAGNPWQYAQQAGSGERGAGSMPQPTMQQAGGIQRPPTAGAPAAMPTGAGASDGRSWFTPQQAQQWASQGQMQMFPGQQQQGQVQAQPWGGAQGITNNPQQQQQGHFQGQQVPSGLGGGYTNPLLSFMSQHTASSLRHR